MNAKRIRLVTVLAGVLFPALTLLAWSQDWIQVTLTDQRALTVAGDVAAPALSALALTGLVLVGALTIAGPAFRAILGVLEGLIGVAVVFSAVLAITRPVAASASAVSDATGQAGAQSIADLVRGATLTPWPWAAASAGVLMIILSIWMVATSRRWPVATHKYQAVRTEVDAPARSSVDDWDSLSGGDDPTGYSTPSDPPR